MDENFASARDMIRFGDWAMMEPELPAPEQEPETPEKGDVRPESGKKSRPDETAVPEKSAKAGEPEKSAVLPAAVALIAAPCKVRGCGTILLLRSFIP